MSTTADIHAEEWDSGVPRQVGYLVLADISGFTAYLAGIELEHAHEILSALFALIARELGGLFTPAHVEGDAVFAHAATARVPSGEAALALLEATYGAFQDELAAMQRRTTCTCNACRALWQLDLKFFVHHGEYMASQIHAHTEFVGLAPHYVRERTWKGPVAEVLGWRGYALFSATSVARLEMDPAGLRTVVLPDLPEGAYAYDLYTPYQAHLAARRVLITPEAADGMLMHDFDAPPAVVWAWLNEPSKRNQWYAASFRWRPGVRPDGHTGVGAVNHCDHGRMGNTVETILDWRPFEYFTVSIEINPGRLVVHESFHFTPLESGRTRVRMTMRAQTRRWLFKVVGPLVNASMGSRLTLLNQLMQTSATA